MRNLILMFILFTMAALKPGDKKDLLITFTNINSPGLIYFGMYKRSDAFPKANSGKPYIADPGTKNSVTVKISDIEYGEYAVALFQDLNGDGKMNTKIFGIPAEPFGFSNNIKPRFSAPKFDKCKFNYSETNYSISIKLITM
ncbi:MAG: hypothetical protein JWN78_3251 [Bacteroidota bacterium]|nr:hypothetical protein [Bacteroidota bacterium]